MVNQAVITIEVAYGLPDKQFLIALQVMEGTTVLEAINQSGVLAANPTINLAKQRVGIFSRFVELNEVVKSGDRIEIYRPLLIDPKEARRAKAKKK
jgi:putative ubiquitin-RnfH superfamily antitoxin RatB of RatAB toxin-antitoxin module